MPGAIFLSASVPDPKRAPEFAETADTVAITAAVSALVYVTLGRRLLVWGGHPAITPMVWVTASDVGVDYGSWVKLYQSRFFQDEFPEDNERFRNAVFSDNINDDRTLSLRAMREKMFSEQEFDAAVFIGGMAGIVEEYDLFRLLQPAGKVLPIISTGGASIVVAENLKDAPSDLAEDLDYVSLFHRHLDISPRENRFERIQDQPLNTADRMWTKPD